MIWQLPLTASVVHFQRMICVVGLILRSLRRVLGMRSESAVVYLCALGTLYALR